MVRDLIDSSGSSWDHNRIRELFSGEVARIIGSIPIGCSAQNDCLRWKFTKDGTYSVKSGYWLAKRAKDVISSKPSSSSPNNNELWKWPWKLNIQPRTKIFLWRCLRGILPTKTNLRARGVEIDVICSRCGMAEENLEHVLRDCEWSTFFWQASVLRLPIGNSVVGKSLRVWILDCIKGKELAFVEMFASLLSMLWRARNLLIFQNRHLSHQVCFKQALSTLDQYQTANQTQLTTRAAPLRPPRWIPPPEGMLKFNSDASIGPSGAAGLGGVFRDCRGVPTKFISGLLPSCFDVEVAEASACLQGVMAAREKGYNKVIFELDNQTLVSKLLRRFTPRTELGTIIADIFHFTDELEEVTFIWINRSQNSLAHEILNSARHSGFVISFSFVCIAYAYSGG